MNKQFEPDEEYLRRQRTRNIVLALILAGFAILFFAITLVRIKEGG
ncbi:MAG: hypothetical protein AB7G24_01860 [Novosphingobium sp.]|jgi:hypothetical protein|nr:hypothetical protein [Sphingomonadaceae bacterium]MCP5378943.1 hypothetical protein [Novosphingobium sp.]